MTKIALVESHTLLRETLAIVLSRNGYTIVNEKDDYDLLLIDHTPVMVGRTAKVVVYAANSSVEAAVLALDAGVSGYILKTDSAPELLHGLKEVLVGETYISHGFANRVIQALRNAALRKAAADRIKLSVREEQIVKALLTGASNKEIGKQLNLSEQTVKHYMSILMQKLSARNRLEVVIAAQRLNEGTRYDQ